MLINLLICNDDDEPLLNEAFNDLDELRARVIDIEYELDARLDHLTGGDHE